MSRPADDRESDSVFERPDTAMEQCYTGLGLRFRYPSDWALSEELGELEANVTVSSPQTAFWSVTILRQRPQPRDVLRAAILAFEEEYDELDIVESEIEVAQQRVLAIEIDFVCLELTNTAFLCAFETARFTVLVVTQLNDVELEAYESLLEQITASLSCEADFAAWRDE